MTDREKAIVMAYTGVVMLIGDKINEYYKYLQELFNRPIYPHEIFYLEKEIKEKAEGDFIRLCDETESCAVDVQEVKHAHWIQRPFGWNECSNCHKEYGIYGGHYCMNCGAKMDEKENKQ